MGHVIDVQTDVQTEQQLPGIINQDFDDNKRVLGEPCCAEVTCRDEPFDRMIMDGPQIIRNLPWCEYEEQSPPCVIQHFGVGFFIERWFHLDVCEDGHEVVEGGKQSKPLGFIYIMDLEAFDGSCYGP